MKRDGCSRFRYPKGFWDVLRSVPAPNDEWTREVTFIGQDLAVRRIVNVGMIHFSIRRPHGAVSTLR